MLEGKEFGICLGHTSATLSNWQAPYDIGTIAKIIECKDIDSTSGHLFLNIRGRRKFRIINLIPPSLKKPITMILSLSGEQKKLKKLHHSDGIEKKMYIQLN